jgi:hypothetical protein
LSGGIYDRRLTVSDEDGEDEDGQFGLPQERRRPDPAGPRPFVLSTEHVLYPPTELQTMAQLLCSVADGQPMSDNDYMNDPGCRPMWERLATFVMAARAAAVGEGVGIGRSQAGLPAETSGGTATPVVL